MIPEQSGAAWSPYLVGASIGVLSWFTFLFSNKPLGAWSRNARVSGMIGKAIAPRHAMSLKYFHDNKPKVDWEVMLVVGVIMAEPLLRGPGTNSLPDGCHRCGRNASAAAHRTRLIVACIGGAMMALGARAARGWLHEWARHQRSDATVRLILDRRLSGFLLAA